MRQFVFFVCLGLLASCSNDEDVELITEKKLEVKDDYEKEEEGVFRAFYGSNNQLKTEGMKDQEGKRHGVWTQYFPDGKTQSVLEYKHGVKDGYSIVYHSNGSIYYSGEYRNDQMVGTWTYYDVQTGKKSEVKELGYPNEKK